MLTRQLSSRSRVQAKYMTNARLRHWCDNCHTQMADPFQCNQTLISSSTIPQRSYPLFHDSQGNQNHWNQTSVKFANLSKVVTKLGPLQKLLAVFLFPATRPGLSTGNHPNAPWYPWVVFIFPTSDCIIFFSSFPHIIGFVVSSLFRHYQLLQNALLP